MWPTNIKQQAIDDEQRAKPYQRSAAQRRGTTIATDRERTGHDAGWHSSTAVSGRGQTHRQPVEGHHLHRLFPQASERRAATCLPHRRGDGGALLAALPTGSARTAVLRGLCRRRCGKGCRRGGRQVHRAAA